MNERDWDGPTYPIAVKDTKTGEVRRMDFPLYGHDDRGTKPEDNLFWWSEGNFGCDCNRGDLFKDIGGEERSLAADCNSGPNRYLVNAGEFLKEFEE